MHNFLAFCCLLFTIPLSAGIQKAKIQFQSDQWNDTLVFLASYQGNSLIVIDTLRLDSKGKAKLNGTFHVGQYALVLPDREQIDLLINENKVKIRQLRGEVSYFNSLENNLFRDFLKIERNLEQKRIRWQQSKGDQSDLAGSIDNLELQRTVFISINREHINNTFAGVLIRAIASPNDLVYYSQHIESAKWIKGRFLDVIDYADERMFYTEIMHIKTKFFIDRVLQNNADTLISHLVELIEMSKPAESTYQFLMEYYLTSLSRSKSPEREVVFKHLFENYCKSGQTPWIDPLVQMRWEADIQALRNQLLGAPPAHIELYDTAGSLLEYDFADQAYTLFIFWDPGCAHCRVEIPQYHRVFKKYQNKKFRVFAIYLESFEEKWKEYIKQENLTWTNAADLKQRGNLGEDYIITETPTVLLIDSNGIIVNKRFTARTLSQFLEAQL